ncbi:hypothetical protein Busp01_49100 [Trinickia caryophylli]|nr:hypothetical protein Busp01_49100 [Trinickia caryophylli]
MCRNPTQRERPIERGVAAARNDDAPPRECGGLPHCVVHMPPFERARLFESDSLRHERSIARRKHNSRGFEYKPLLRRNDPALVAATLLDPHHALAQMNWRRKRLALFDEPFDQLARSANGYCRNIEDRFFWVELGALPAHLIERIDEMTGQPDYAGLKSGKESHWAGTDDEDVGTYRIVSCRCVAHSLIPDQAMREVRITQSSIEAWAPWKCSGPLGSRGKPDKKSAAKNAALSERSDDRVCFRSGDAGQPLLPFG